MAGVEIDADRLADRVAQSEEGADTVDILVAVQFEAELLYADASGISDKVPPIRDQHLFPLVAQDLLCLGRPARRHPIGVGIAWPTRAARHHDHPFDPQKTGEGDRLARDLPMPPARLARMQRIARAVEGADQKAVVAEPDHELFSSRRAVEHSVKRQVRGSRPVAGSKLQSLDAELGGGPRRSSKDSSPRLSVIMPIFIALPSQAHSRRCRTQVSETEPGISERWRLCRILLGLDD